MDGARMAEAERRPLRKVTDPAVLERRRAALAKARDVRNKKLAAEKAEIEGRIAGPRKTIVGHRAILRAYVRDPLADAASSVPGM